MINDCPYHSKVLSICIIKKFSLQITFKTPSMSETGLTFLCYGSNSVTRGLFGVFNGDDVNSCEEQKTTLCIHKRLNCVLRQLIHLQLTIDPWEGCFITTLNFQAYFVMNTAKIIKKHELYPLSSVNLIWKFLVRRSILDLGPGDLISF